MFCVVVIFNRLFKNVLKTGMVLITIFEKLYFNISMTSGISSNRFHQTTNSVSFRLNETKLP